LASLPADTLLFGLLPGRLGVGEPLGFGLPHALLDGALLGRHRGCCVSHPLGLDCLACTRLVSKFPGRGGIGQPLRVRFLACALLGIADILQTPGVVGSLLSGSCLDLISRLPARIFEPAIRATQHGYHGGCDGGPPPVCASLRWRGAGPPGAGGLSRPA